MSTQELILTKLREIYPAGLTPFEASSVAGVPFRIGLHEVQQLKWQGLIISRLLGGVERIYLATPPAEAADEAPAPEPEAPPSSIATLPDIGSLAEAVQAVVQSNTAAGYSPVRLTEASRGLTGLLLVREIERLILDGAPLEPVEPAVLEEPSLLTVEDFVARFGTLWGFGPTAIERVRARVGHFDELAGQPRFS